MVGDHHVIAVVVGIVGVGSRRQIPGSVVDSEVLVRSRSCPPGGRNTTHAWLCNAAPHEERRAVEGHTRCSAVLWPQGMGDDLQRGACGW
jgi:hypothetical protein